MERPHLCSLVLGKPCSRPLSFTHSPMTERFTNGGAAANSFGRRWLHVWEARLLQQVNYPTLPDMRMVGAWQLSTGDVPCLHCPPAQSAPPRSR